MQSEFSSYRQTRYIELLCRNPKRNINISLQVFGGKNRHDIVQISWWMLAVVFIRGTATENRISGYDFFFFEKNLICREIAIF